MSEWTDACMHHPVPPASSTDQETEARPWQVQTYREFFTRVGIQRVSGHLTDGARSTTQGQRNTGNQEGGREPAPPPPGEPARLDPRCHALWGWLLLSSPSPRGRPRALGSGAPSAGQAQRGGRRGLRRAPGAPQEPPPRGPANFPGPRAGDHQGRLFV